MYLLTIIIILFMFVLNISLSVLNYKNRNQPIPDNVQDVYDKSKYGHWLEYTMDTFRFSLIVKTFNMLVLLLMLFFGVFNQFATVADTMTNDPVNNTIVFLGLYFMFSYVLGLGFNIYKTFVLEHKYGFNKTTPLTFVKDQVKSMVLTILFGGAILFVLLSLYVAMGSQSLLYAWAFVSIVIVLVNLLYHSVFIRLFNKLSPLEEGELFERAKALAKSTDYELKSISIIDASKRSSRLNAYFSGFGRFKHVILYDTLIEKCSTDEVIGILAHEIGHAKHKDILHNLFISLLMTGFYLLCLMYFLSSEAFSLAFGFDGVHIGFVFILFGILLEPLGTLINIPLTAMSRRAEYKADHFASQTTDSESMISALKVLARENYSNLTPHPLVVKMTYSHPTISQRIDALKNN